MENVTVDGDPLGVVNNSVTLIFRILNASPVVLPSNIEWEFNDVVLNDTNSQYSFSPDRLSLTISNLTHSNEGLYTLTATNEAGVGSANIFLNIEGSAEMLN